MKKNLFLLSLLFTSFVFAQIVNIPDANFKKRLLERYVKDLNGNYFGIDVNRNGEIEVSEAENVSELNVTWQSISTLEGILSFKNLQTLDCSSNQLTSLDVQGLTNLQSLECQYNQLTSLNVQGCTNLQNLHCSNNLLPSLNVQGCTNLQNLSLPYNKLTSLNIQGLINLQDLRCWDNQLTSLNVQGLTNLQTLICEDNQLTSLNVQGLTNLQWLTCWNNQLTSLNLKTGVNKVWYNIDFNTNPNLKYICCNEKDIAYVVQKVKSDGQSAEVNTYCSFAPSGEKNTITGKLNFDINNNGCDANDALAKNIKVKLNDGTTTGYSITNETANYTFYTQTGNFTLTPIFENPYYTVSPTTVSFTDANNNVKTQDFCIKPIANKNDLTVSIVPVDRARPGFDANYQIIYKNKGTTTLSGEIIYGFQSNFVTLVSSDVTPSSTETGKLKYTFTDLKPFEEKIINIKLKLNTPTHLTYPLDGDEILSFNAQILPIQNDAAPRDNIFALRQEVVNSFDPNDKTCLQGNSITPDMIGNYVDYQIRFENTGSAEATFIVVKDIIDTNLFDIESLTPVASSHPYHLTIKNGNVVEFYFENINLPFPPSELRHGFITFKIKTKSTLKVGDVLKNKADIYFDYNKPIVTNEEFTKIENLSSDEISNLNTQTPTLFTNPVKDVIKFSEEVKSILIYDLTGKLVQSSIIKGTEANVSSLKSGNYVIKISTENGNVNGKLIKN